MAKRRKRTDDDTRRGMVIANRGVGEQIIAIMPDGRQIKVELTRIRNAHRANIGISAPADVKILRRELLEEVSDA